ncbi:MAG: hypothetical protein HY560_13160 [Gemmatimonadetes bacterium]|nr:hypothetical protein [Gemmatimonadota bacterium]
MKRVLAITAVAAVACAGAVAAQIKAPGEEGSRNVHVFSHIPLGKSYTIGDIEVEQELSRPYAYVMRTFGEAGFDIIHMKDPQRAGLLYRWRVENPELHVGIGGSDGHYVKHKGRYFFAVSMQFTQNGPDADLGVVLVDVTGLPDTTKIKEAARIRIKDPGAGLGGFHTLYPYKHSDGRVVLFATSMFGPALVYDLGRIIDGGSAEPIGRVPNGPGANNRQGYHDMYVAFDPATKQDRFYGAGLDVGYFVYDVTRPEEPKLLTSLTGIAGLNAAHTFMATPDGRYAVTQMEYQYAPIRIFDLKPGLDGQVQSISRPIGAWAANWKLASHNHELRWPYVFVAAFNDGLQVFNMMDPTNPYTVGYYDTHSGALESGLDIDDGLDKVKDGKSIFNGLWGVDVRNADGLIVVSDFRTGFWSFKMDGFDGWNGHQWGMPNVSSVQDWDNGPEGAPKPQRVS